MTHQPAMQNDQGRAGAVFARAHNEARRGDVLVVNTTTGATRVVADAELASPTLEEVIYDRGRVEISDKQGQAMLDVADMVAAVKRR